MIIGLSGYKQSGKDTVCKIIQYLTCNNNISFQEFQDGPFKYPFNCVEGIYWQNKKFADRLKDVVCLLIGCTREQLEDNNFKETPLGEEWWHYRFHVGGLKLIPYLENKDKYPSAFLIKLTPRLLLQLLGTECGRNIIHPNIWVNALMSEYTPTHKTTLDNAIKHDFEKEAFYPNWVITDVRFPNEAQAIKDRGGIIFRIVNNRIVSTDLHESETALDNYGGFDDIIYNHWDIPKLIDTMKQVLQIHKII